MTSTPVWQLIVTRHRWSIAASSLSELPPRQVPARARDRYAFRLVAAAGGIHWNSLNRDVTGLNTLTILGDVFLASSVGGLPIVVFDVSDDSSAPRWRSMTFTGPPTSNESG
jgi:hypothetical protein